jgi:hypothetical protein
MLATISSPELKSQPHLRTFLRKDQWARAVGALPFRAPLLAELQKRIGQRAVSDAAARTALRVHGVPQLCVVHACAPRAVRADGKLPASCIHCVKARQGEVRACAGECALCKAEKRELIIGDSLALVWRCNMQHAAELQSSTCSVMGPTSQQPY